MMKETMREELGRMMACRGGGSLQQWRDMDSFSRTLWMRDADVAIAFFRKRLENPTREMLLDFLQTANPDDGPRRMSGSARELWQIMADIVLSGAEE